MAADEGAKGLPVATLLTTGLGLFMIFVDATIVNVALPDLQTDFGVGEADLQWVVASYSVTMGMFMMSGATLADRRGRRLAYVGGLVLFGGASIACGLAPSIGALTLARSVQGVGAAVVNVASLALVSAAFTDPGRKAKAIGIWTGIATVGLAVGPTLGGLLTDAFGWRSIFAVNPLIAGIALVLSYRYLDESRDPRTRPFDLPGQLLFIVGVGALTYYLIEGPQSGWLSPELAVTGVTALVLVAAFIVVELRTPQPMMELRVFADSVYTASILTVFCVLFGVYGTLLIITQYFQNVHDYSAQTAGLLMLFMTVPSIVFAPISGRLTASIGGRRPALIGLTAGVVGPSILALTTGGFLGFTLVGLSVIAIAAGLAMPAATAVAMSSIPPDRSGMASGILSVQRALGSTAGFAIMGSILAAVVSMTLADNLAPYISDEQQRDEVVETVSDDADPRAMASLIGPGRPLPDEVAEEPELVDAADASFVDGIRLAEAVAALVALGALVFAWRVLPKQERAGTEEAEFAEEVALEERDP